MAEKITQAEEDRFILSLTDEETADATCPECGYVSEDYLKANVCPQCEAAKADLQK